MNNDTTNFRDILQNNSKLKNIYLRIGMVRSVYNDLQQLVPQRFQGKYQVNNVEGSTLILTVRSAIIATQLRLITAQLIKELQRHGGKTSKTIKRITIRMQPIVEDLVRDRNERTLPEPIKQQMLQLSYKVRDKKLSASLQKLAGTTTTNTRQAHEQH